MYSLAPYRTHATAHNGRFGNRCCTVPRIFTASHLACGSGRPAGACVLLFWVPSSIARVFVWRRGVSILIFPSFYDVNHTHLPSSCDAEITTQNTKNSQL